MNYQATGQGGGIGALLRRIQEDTAQSPLATPPNSEAGSPIRGVVQQPLSQVEAPDSSRVIVTRPELAQAPGESVPGTTVPAASPIEAPVVGPRVVAPVQPVTPATEGGPVAPAQNNQPSQSNNNPSSNSGQSSTSRPIQTPSLATSIKPSAAVLSSTTKAPAPTPKPSVSLTPTQTSSSAKPKQAAPARVGPLMVQDILNNIQKTGKNLGLNLAQRLFG